MYARWLRPLLFRLPPELAHHLGLLGMRMVIGLPILRQFFRKKYFRAQGGFRWRGIEFRNPVGLAAGFDKNGRLAHGIDSFGFGFLEVGSVTAKAWLGNPTPRLFRLPADKALVNRMGLNNEGAERISLRLSRKRRKTRTPVLVNIAKTADPAIEGEMAVEDYLASVRQCRTVADALVLNISCPNSGDGRTFEDPVVLGRLLEQVMGEVGRDGIPTLVKFSPDTDADTFVAGLNLCREHGLAGVVVSNTTVQRGGLRTTREDLNEIGQGGLSGEPLLGRTVARVRLSREILGADALIIGVGGISTPADALEVFNAGANLIEGYAGFVYGGPEYAGDIVDALSRGNNPGA